MSLPALISARELNLQLHDPQLLIIDLRAPEHYTQGHIPGAVNIPPPRLSCGQPPAPGKLPSLDELAALLGNIGLSQDRQVVTYDDAGGSWAGRMIWTLALLGFDRSSLLDGGFGAWQKAGFALSQEIPQIQPTQLKPDILPGYIADKQEILQNLDNPQYKIWDARSAEEYRGEKVHAARGGHIPGAINLDWTRLMDEQLKLLPADQLSKLLQEAGFSKDQTIATHCQTHRRSGLTWFVARKLLGWPHVKAYPGSWSEWGNCEDTPIEN